MLSAEQARQQLLDGIRPLSGFEVLPLHDGVDRILAEDLIASRDVPPADNAAMDGFAVRVADLMGSRMLSLVGTSLAGEPFRSAPPAGTCVRIMTGALVPPECDAVIMQEQCRQDGDGNEVNVIPERVPDIGENIRRTGEDIAAGVTLLQEGRRLRPADIGLLASQGLSLVKVFRKLKAALMATGSELREPGESPAAGQIYDSNRHVLAAMLKRLGAAVTDLGICRDEPDLLEEALLHAAEDHDVIIASGGVSVGQADQTRKVLERIGRMAVWKVAMRPGKPFAFGYIRDVPFFGLPGNPVSAVVTFDQLAVPVLRRMAGEQFEDDGVLSIPAVTTETLRKKPGRADFQRAILRRRDDGVLVVQSTGEQGSGILSSLSRANAFIYLEAERGPVEAGETVTVLPFDRWLM